MAALDRLPFFYIKLMCTRGDLVVYWGRLVESSGGKWDYTNRWLIQCYGYNRLLYIVYGIACFDCDGSSTFTPTKQPFYLHSSLLTNAPNYDKVGSAGRSLYHYIIEARRKPITQYILYVLREKNTLYTMSCPFCGVSLYKRNVKVLPAI